MDCCATDRCLFLRAEKSFSCAHFRDLRGILVESKIRFKYSLEEESLSWMSEM